VIDTITNVLIIVYTRLKYISVLFVRLMSSGYLRSATTASIRPSSSLATRWTRESRGRTRTMSSPHRRASSYENRSARATTSSAPRSHRKDLRMCSNMRSGRPWPRPRNDGNVPGVLYSSMFVDGVGVVFLTKCVSWMFILILRLFSRYLNHCLCFINTSNCGEPPMTFSIAPGATPPPSTPNGRGPMICNAPLC